MQFGIFDHMEVRGGELGALYEERLRMLEAAEACGFARYHKAEHHFTPLDAAPSSSVFLAAASQRTRRIRLGALVLLLPFYHPVRLIEEICALDHLTGGRLDVGVGRGISPIEHRLWGNVAEDAAARTVDAIEILRAGLTGPRLTHASAWHTFNDLPMTMTPVQRPHPPLWYPGNVEFAGTHRLNTVVGGPNGAVKAQVARFRALTAQAATDWNPGVAVPIIGATRHIFVAPTRAQALERARPAWTRYDDNLMSLWRAHGVTTPGPSPTMNGDFDAALAANVALVGTPDDMRDHVTALREDAGLDYFVGAFAWGDLTHAETLSSMQLFADAVIGAPVP